MAGRISAHYKIAIRTALGAQRGDIRALVLRQARTLLVIGLVMGSALALVGADLARSLVFAVEPQDLRLVGLAAAVLKR